MPNIQHFSRIDDCSGFAGAPVGFGGVTPDSDMAWLKEECKLFFSNFNR